MPRKLIYEVNTVAAIQVTLKTIYIIAAGKTRTSGWKNPALDPRIYVMPPADGIQEFDFTAAQPTGPHIPVLSPIAAQRIWINPPKWVKGVRVYAETNKKQVPISKMTKDVQAKATKAAAAKPAAKKTGKKR